MNLGEQQQHLFEALRNQPLFKRATIVKMHEDIAESDIHETL